MAGITVKILLVQGTIPDCSHDAVYFRLHTGFHKVVPGVDSGHGALLETPVCHHNSVKAPLVTENGGEKAMALLCISAVEPVV